MQKENRPPVPRFHKDNIIPKGDWVWVFGSNKAGRHGKGAAKVAHVSFQAAYGVGHGATGNAYAISTKDKGLRLLDITDVSANVCEFLHFAKCHSEKSFFVTRIGCGLAGFDDKQIAPLFMDAPENCSLPEEWQVLVFDSEILNIN